MSEEGSKEYLLFVEKFKTKKTTDDCYTPTLVYDAVAKYVTERYGVSRSRFVRPFYPGGDYERDVYAADAVVVDNPPFSILSTIVSFYIARKIQFFLFAPGLTLFNLCNKGATGVICGVTFTYANGAKVNTAFVTNMDDKDCFARVDCELRDALLRAEKESTRKKKKQVAKLAFPDAVVTAARMGFYAAHHTPYEVRRSDGVFTRKLDNLCGEIFGGGFLLCERAAAERAAAERAAAERAAAECAAAERVQLSPREVEIQKIIGGE